MKLFKKRGDKLNFLRKIFEGKEKERKNVLLLIFLIGILLITFAPKFTQNNNVTIEPTTETKLINSDNLSYERDLEFRLEEILSSVEGAGDVSVMITTSKGSEIIVSENIEQNNNTVSEIDSNNGTRTTHQDTTKRSAQILGQNEEPLILTEIVPEISGVIIVSEGANDVIVKDSLIRSVSTLLGIPTYKIEVLPKK